MIIFGLWIERSGAAKIENYWLSPLSTVDIERSVCVYAIQWLIETHFVALVILSELFLYQWIGCSRNKSLSPFKSSNCPNCMGLHLSRQPFALSILFSQDENTDSFMSFVTLASGRLEPPQKLARIRFSFFLFPICRPILIIILRTRAKSEPERKSKNATHTQNQFRESISKLEAAYNLKYACLRASTNNN